MSTIKLFKDHKNLIARGYKSNIHKIPVKVVLTGISDYNLMLKIKNFFRLNQRILQCKPSTYEDIHLICKYMKASGFFTSIQAIYDVIEGKPKVYIQLAINPILSKVSILGDKSKLIPKQKLKKIFTEQIGFPKSVTKIKESINMILDWYYLRGYKWVQIEICQENIPLNELAIVIHEGCLDSIIVNYIPGHLKLTTSLLAKKLQLKLGDALSLIELQEKLQYAKNNGLVENIYYQIIPAPKNKHNLQLILDIYHLPHQGLYFFIINSIFFSLLRYCSVWNPNIVSQIFKDVTNPILQELNIFHDPYVGFKYYYQNFFFHDSLMVILNRAYLFSSMKLMFTKILEHKLSKFQTIGYIHFLLFNNAITLTRHYTKYIHMDINQIPTIYINMAKLDFLPYMKPEYRLRFNLQIQNLETKYIKSYYNPLIGPYFWRVNFCHFYKQITNYQRRLYNKISQTLIRSKLKFSRKVYKNIFMIPFSLNFSLESSYWFLINARIKPLYNESGLIYGQNINYNQVILWQFGCKDYIRSLSINFSSSYFLGFSPSTYYEYKFVSFYVKYVPDLVIHLPHTFWNLRIQYIFAVSNWLNPFIYIQYSEDFYNKFNFFSSCNDYIFNKKLDLEMDISKKKLLQGIGIQLRFPFKQIPVIYIEYIFNKNNGKKIYIKI
uniref:hypothetical protein n=1 Tax=Glaucosphaera vacuolata TaxID=38265 RepID=UPI001FCD636B|nr:hypothetical protein MW444_pgp015 [Glaucosphaera vacuolata]UNJ18745.1 hypothetical protein [Glaucosphaera vacuolata]